MNILIKDPVENQQFEFAEIRARAMKESLCAINRFDEKRVRDRVFDDYIPHETKAIYQDESLVGFYSVKSKVDCKYIVHLYIDPDHQGLGIGASVLNSIISQYSTDVLRLNALQKSRSNQFYQKFGFIKIGEDEFDVYYELSPKSKMISAQYVQNI